jgi:hypothetical protein
MLELVSTKNNSDYVFIKKVSYLYCSFREVAKKIREDFRGVISQ